MLGSTSCRGAQAWCALPSTACGFRHCSSAPAARCRGAGGTPAVSAASGDVNLAS